MLLDGGDGDLAGGLALVVQRHDNLVRFEGELRATMTAIYWATPITPSVLVKARGTLCAEGWQTRPPEVSQFLLETLLDDATVLSLSAHWL